MGTGSKIPWCDHTWNPIQGCTKVSAACAHCYMYRDKKRYGQDPSIVIRSAPATFRKPLAKNRDGSWKWKDGSLVFTCSWSDWFHEDADEWRDEMWEVIRQRPGLIFLILTKRSDRILDHLPSDWGPDGWENVWLGVTVENQESVGRIEDLSVVPAALRFISAEPLLGRLWISEWLWEGPASCLSCDGTGEQDGKPCDQCDRGVVHSMDWLIVGGESGSEARPTAPDWFKTLRDECGKGGVPFYFKQWGEWQPLGLADESRGLVLRQKMDGGWVARLGRKNDPGTLDGVAHREFPLAVPRGVQEK